MVGPREQPSEPPVEPHGPGLQGLRRARHGARPARRGDVPGHRARPSPVSPASPRSSSPATCAPRASSSRPPSPTACAPRGRRSPTSAWPRPTSCTSLGASRRARRHVHGVAQPGPVQRHEAVPRRGPAGGQRQRPRRHPRPRPRRCWASPCPGADGGPARARPARGVGRPRGLLRRRRLVAPAQGGRRHRQRDGRLRRADRVQAPALRGRDPLPRARRHLPQPPGGPDPAREPGGAQAGRARPGGGHRPGLRRGRRPRLPRRRAGRARVGLAHHGARRRLHAHEAPGRDDPLQPDLLARRARDRHRARAACRCVPGSGTPSSRR